MASYDTNKLTRVAALKALAEKIKGEYDALDAKVDGIISTGGEPNKIDSIAVNGVVVAPDGQKKVSITVPKKVAELEDHASYATKAEMDAKVSSVYKPGGSKAFAQLPTPGAEYLGLVYNVTDAFTTTASFVEGASNKYPKGTNVVVVQDGEDYKFDVLAGFVDLSSYATNSGVDTKLQSYVTNEALTAKDYATNAGVKAGYVAKDGTKVLSTNDYTTAEKNKLAGLSNYTHPASEAGGSKESALYKIATDANGHVSAATAATSADIAALGVKITDTTYQNATGSVSGLMSGADKTKLDGIAIATDEEITAMLDEVFAAE